MKLEQNQLKLIYWLSVKTVKREKRRILFLMGHEIKVRSYFRLFQLIDFI